MYTAGYIYIHVGTHTSPTTLKSIQMNLVNDKCYCSRIRTTTVHAITYQKRSTTENNQQYHGVSYLYHNLRLFIISNYYSYRECTWL